MRYIVRLIMQFVCDLNSKKGSLAFTFFSFKLHKKQDIEYQVGSRRVETQEDHQQQCQTYFKDECFACLIQHVSQRRQYETI